VIIVTDLPEEGHQIQALREERATEAAEGIPVREPEYREHRPGTVPLTTGAKAIIREERRMIMISRRF